MIEKDQALIMAFTVVSIIYWAHTTGDGGDRTTRAGCRGPDNFIDDDFDGTLVV